MRKTVTLLLLAAAASLALLIVPFLSCAGNPEKGSGAPPHPNEKVEGGEMENPDDPVVGGLTPIDTGHEMVQMAYEELLSYIEKEGYDAELAPPVEAQSQIVAGMNIYLTCPYTEKGTDRTGTVTATVYIDLDENREVTEFTME